MLRSVKADRNKLISKKLFFPIVLVVLMWIIKFAEFTFGLNLAEYGLYPRTISGLFGIFTSPFIHSDLYHLFSNTIPLVILGGMMFHFYRSIAFKVFFWVYIMTGIWVWAAGREAYHIGASGLIYGFVFFLFFSGIFRKDKRMRSLSLLVTFVYGGLVWGMVPVGSTISWESHALGALAGIITAFNYRKNGPQPKKYSWELEPESDSEPTAGTTDGIMEKPPLDSNNDVKELNINYIYLPEEGVKEEKRA